MIGLALGALPLVVLYLYVEEPLVNRSRQLTELGPAREATLEARRRLIAQRPRLAEELAEATRAFEQQTTRLLLGPTAPIAASELQRVVKEVPAGANVDVRSERVLPRTNFAGLQEVPVELTVAGSIRDTVVLLYQLGRTSRLLTAKDVKLCVVAGGQPPELLTTLTVAGYLLPAAGGN
jgi:type II secretion system (T2SS) protein M